MMRVAKLVVAGLIIFICSGPLSNLSADWLVVNADYTSPGQRDSDLTIVNGSVNITAAGDLIVNGDLKVIAGSVFMGPNAGKLKVRGDLIVTNTKPGGDASVITHNDLIVTGAIITRSTYGDAIVTTTGAAEIEVIEAERIITRGYGDSSVRSKLSLTVIAEIDTQSITGNASIESGGNLHAGSIITDANITGSVEALDIDVLGEIVTLARDGSASIYASVGDIYAGSITTSGAGTLGTAEVRATVTLDVLGDIRTTSIDSDAGVYALGGSLYAGSVVTDGYGFGEVNAGTRIIVTGDIISKSRTSDAAVFSLLGIGDFSHDIIAANIITNAASDAVIWTYSDIVVRRDISTTSSGDGFAFVKSSLGSISAYSITTSGVDHSYVQADNSISTQGCIRTRAMDGYASVDTTNGGISAESIFTHVSGLDSDANIDSATYIEVKDLISTKNDGYDAFVFARGGDIFARSITTDALELAYIRSDSSISVVGDIRTHSVGRDAYVWAPNGDVKARSIQTKTDDGNRDDSIVSAAGSGEFELFPNTIDTKLAISNSEFFLDSGRSWNTTLSIDGSCTFNGNGHKLIFGDDAGIFVSMGASLLLKNIIIDNVGGTAIQCEDNTATLSILNTTWTLTSDMTFGAGALQVFGDCVIEGPTHEFKYESTRTSTINIDSTLEFTKSVTFCYNTDASRRIWMLDETSRLKFDNASLVSVGDMRLTKGTLVFDNAVTFYVDAENAIYLGNLTVPDNIYFDNILGSEFFMYGELEDENV